MMIILFISVVFVLLQQKCVASNLKEDARSRNHARNGENMICPAGEYCREEACHRIPPGLYTITSEDLALPCEMSNLPGAAYCNLDAGSDCKPGQYENLVKECLPVPEGYYNPNKDSFGVYYKCPHNYVSDGGIQCVETGHNSTLAKTEMHRILQSLPPCSTNVVIPNGITSIPNNAYQGCGLSTLVIAASVSSIGNYAFASCGSLTTVTFATGSQLTSIGFQAFIFCRSLGTLLMPNTVTSIGGDSFYQTGIRVATLSSSLTSMGTYAFYQSALVTVTGLTTASDYAFNGCSNLQTVEMLDLNAPVYIGYQTFMYCSSLRSFTMSNTVSSIGGYAFYQSGSSMTVHIGNGSTSIGTYAFSRASIGSISIGTGLQAISDYCFNGAHINSIVFAKVSTLQSIGFQSFIYTTGLTSIDIPDSVTSIGGDSFYQSSVQVVNMPFSLTSMGTYCFYQSAVVNVYDLTLAADYSFYGCSSLETVSMSNSKTPNTAYIGFQAFIYCPRLKSFIMSDTVSSIGGDAFYQSGSSMTFYMGNGVTSIGTYAFYQASIDSIYVGSGLQAISDYCFDGAHIGSISFSKDSTLKSIGFQSFIYTTGLTTIHIPDSVTSIGGDSFYQSSVQVVKMPLSLTSMGTYCFYQSAVVNVYNLTLAADYSFDGCSSLKTVVMSNCASPNTAYIGFQAFIYCSHLQSFIMSNSVISIGGDAFYQSGSSMTFYMGNGDTTIGTYAFYQASIDSIYIGSGLQAISDYCFDGAHIGSITFAKDSILQSIGFQSFIYTTGITSIAIPDSVTSIGGDSFYQSSVQNVRMSSGLTSMGSNSFYQSALVTITNLPLVGDYAFFGCSSLKNVGMINTGISSYIGFQSFIYCSSLQSITLPSSVRSVGTDAFYGCGSLRYISFGTCPAFGSTVFAYTPPPCMGTDSAYCPSSGLHSCISVIPSEVPTSGPTILNPPTRIPTVAPTSPTHRPTRPTRRPTSHPTTSHPTIHPSAKPSKNPTSGPTLPSQTPTSSPTVLTNYLASFTTTQAIHGTNQTVLLSNKTQNAFVSTMQHIFSTLNPTNPVSVEILSIVPISNPGPTPTYGYVYNTTYIVPNGAQSIFIGSYQALSNTISQSTLNNNIASTLLSVCGPTCGLSPSLTVSPDTTSLSDPNYIQTPAPTSAPSSKPIFPTTSPSTHFPTSPTITPSYVPTSPTELPSKKPSAFPTRRPSNLPTPAPSLQSLAPTIQGQCFCDVKYCFTFRKLNATFCEPGSSPQVYQ